MAMDAKAIADGTRIFLRLKTALVLCHKPRHPNFSQNTPAVDWTFTVFFSLIFFYFCFFRTFAYDFVFRNNIIAQLIVSCQMT